MKVPTYEWGLDNYFVIPSSQGRLILCDEYCELVDTERLVGQDDQGREIYQVFPESKRKITYVPTENIETYTSENQHERQSDK